MTLPSQHRAELLRMQEARRHVQRQLDIIDRQINRRMTALIPQLRPRQSGYRCGRAPDASAFLERYRSQLAALTAERQPEIDALTRKLARQDFAIDRFLERHGGCPDGRAA
ncbi:hypothetical protein [Mesorhizobium sp.]|uniref:hypothetical protein n=1 Tax=Mesorhizobium sp. TaxID=1871066 RepID=UPI000FE7EC00|nr:hypothetical protein [Mesorhizobium sp.]RWB66213.1 MAG: hypothetical protein EOQ49_29495 [Mesorhizobium sp.]TIT05147.1 MAG: hypothetical protein E5W74_33015 [Mesorhizobium sp.]TIV77359.1 MAG: hypothetical protein E5V64_30885 [Mesorhizobium sp.]